MIAQEDDGLTPIKMLVTHTRSRPLNQFGTRVDMSRIDIATTAMAVTHHHPRSTGLKAGSHTGVDILLHACSTKASGDLFTIRNTRAALHIGKDIDTKREGRCSIQQPHHNQ